MLCLCTFEKLAKDSLGVKSEEILHIRFIVSLFRYLFEQNSTNGKQTEFQHVPAVLTIAFQEMVGDLFEVHLRVRFPDRILENATDLRDMCIQAWERYENDEMGFKDSFFLL